MTILHILILSVIQGLTEFLPISSSGHLILLPNYFGWENQGFEMDIALHVGTLLAVLIYFRDDIWGMSTHFFRFCLQGFRLPLLDDQVRLALSLVVATLPAVVVGFILKKLGMDQIRQVGVIATTSIVFGLVLFASDHFGPQKKSLQAITLKQGFLIGLAQAIALVPGVSRSGICISAALSLGFTRIAAARFAFLMSIPSILGAATLTTIDVVKEGTPLVWNNIGLAIIFSGMAGIAAIHLMMTFLARHSLTPFVIYRILLGLGILLIL